jgi:hypothetical protein
MNLDGFLPANFDGCATFASKFLNRAAGRTILSESAIPLDLQSQLLSDEENRFFVMPSNIPATDRSFYFPNNSTASEFYPS